MRFDCGDHAPFNLQLAPKGEWTRNRRDVDNPSTTPSLSHQFGCATCEFKRRDEISFKQRANCDEVKCRKRPAVAQANIVHQNIRAAGLAFDTFECNIKRGLIGDVEG